MKQTRKINFTLNTTENKSIIVATVSVSVSVRPDMAAYANNLGIDPEALSNLIEMKLDNIMASVATSVNEPLEDTWS